MEFQPYNNFHHYDMRLGYIGLHPFRYFLIVTPVCYPKRLQEDRFYSHLLDSPHGDLRYGGISRLSNYMVEVGDPIVERYLQNLKSDYGI